MLYGESLASLFGLQLYDPDTKELWIDTDEFRQCMELLKALYPLMEREWEHPSTMDAKPMQALLHRDKLFYLVETHQFREAGALQEWDLLDTNEQLLSIPVPNQLGTQPTAYGWQMAAVNRNGRNPYNAYAFLKLLMSADQQTSVIPINQEAAERRLRENFTRSEEAYAGMLEDLQNVRYVHPFSPVQWEFLLESMEPWFTGERAYDVCLEALRGRLDTYVHE